MLVQAEVDEALRLTRMSKYSLLEDDGNTRVQDPISAVYCAIRDDALKSGKHTYTWRDLVALLGRDFSVRPAQPACNLPVASLSRACLLRGLLSAEYKPNPATGGVLCAMGDGAC